ncbi:UDP-glucuronatexylan alpha-glucuronosyltransferase 2 [Nymphaea thermarum]|nr:UDP-glucuronatexylan alpha-glucuronosyltransferase 2 [Nymphaea thermarum]
MASLFMQIKLMSVALILLIASLTFLLLKYGIFSGQESGRRDAVHHDCIDSPFLKTNATATHAAVVAAMETMKNKKIGLVNLESDRLRNWDELDYVEEIQFKRVDPNITWEHLFPAWVDEEEEVSKPECPEIPMPEEQDGDGGRYGMVVARLPCGHRWKRDVFRLQVHLVVAKLASYSPQGVVVVLLSACRPMVELFRCEDLVNRWGDAWVFRPDVQKLREKLALPVGSCRLVLPLLKKKAQGELQHFNSFSCNRLSYVACIIHVIGLIPEGREIVDYDFSKLDNLHQEKEMQNTSPSLSPPREAYATVIHSSDSYVCGAIALARSLIHTGTTRDLVLLLHINGDKDGDYHRRRMALMEAGWKIQEIERIRNPKAKKGAYNEWNYTKLRLWQITGYHKIIYIDSDLIVLKNIDRFFGFPQLSAAANSRSMFNSGFMVIEPSQCTFKILMELIPVVRSYNGGDQGFLNEVFTWWHRLPKRVNMLKIFGSPVRVANNTRIMGSEPPELYALHYLGIKPWLCYRDYDCNWNVENQRLFANDVAHARWWKLYDLLIPTSLQPFCLLSERRKVGLQREIEKAQTTGYSDQHWLKAIKDTRQY